MTDITEIWKFPLRRGNSSDPRQGACLLDAVSWLEYGTLGDHPVCVCPVIAAFGRGINDAMSDDGRQRLRVFIPRLVGTVDPHSQQARAEYLAWQAIRVFAPVALDAAGFREPATALRNFEGSLQDAARAAIAARAAARAALAGAEAALASGAARAAEAAARAAIAAARAAEAGTDAARAAARAAEAAARAAARAAGAGTDADAAVAEATAASSIEDAMIIALDGVLAIGRQAEPIDAQQAWLAIRNFELAIS